MTSCNYTTYLHTRTRTIRWAQPTHDGQSLNVERHLLGHCRDTNANQNENARSASNGRDGDDDDETKAKTKASPKHHVETNAVVANDATRATTATRHIQNGNALVYQGDYRNAKQLLTAIKRRITKSQLRVPFTKPGTTTNTNTSNTTTIQTNTITQQWNEQRRRIRELSQQMNMVMVQVDSDHTLRDLDCAPNNEVVRTILSSNYSQRKEPYVMPLRELLGMIGAHEWYKRGVFIPHIQTYIYPHYGVFAPTRNEYLDLIDRAPTTFFHPNPNTDADADANTGAVMMDIGIGTGVIAALMLQKGNIGRVIGTDTNPSAIACAKDNMVRLGLSDKVELVQANIFPPRRTDRNGATKADLIICNPPWLPGKPESWLDCAVYDEDSSFLREFLSSAHYHLNDRNPHAEVWLVLSDMAERLGLRAKDEVIHMIESGNLQIVDVHHTLPAHSKAVTCQKKSPSNEPFKEVAAARAAETVSLYRLRQKI